MVFSISLFYCVIKKLVHLVISNCIHAKIILLCINFWKILCVLKSLNYCF